jgi:hypothetical protein
VPVRLVLRAHRVQHRQLLEHRHPHLRLVPRSTQPCSPVGQGGKGPPRRTGARHDAVRGANRCVAL